VRILTCHVNGSVLMFMSASRTATAFTAVQVCAPKNAIVDAANEQSIVLCHAQGQDADFWTRETEGVMEREDCLVKS
jgi:hypothetical protein